MLMEICKRVVQAGQMKVQNTEHAPPGSLMALLRRTALRCIRPLHALLRRRRLDLFLQLARATAGDSLLDVGGGLGIGGEFHRLYESFDSVTIANLRIGSNGLIHAPLRLVAADGCALPFEPCAFDWVFSNAVIEHVGPWEKQRQFAQEVRRVAKKGYFVATPNRHFPVDPHTLLPFYQFMPPGLQRVALRLSPGYLTAYEEITLLSARQLGAFFPEAQILKTGLPGLPNVLVAFYRPTS